MDILNNTNAVSSKTRSNRDFKMALGLIRNSITRLSEITSHKRASIICDELLNALYYSFADIYPTMDDLKQAITDRYDPILIPKVLMEKLCKKEK